ncbi:protein of unknown function [Streptantibioticus cattleyicolor NRRL 8057 = DSM 46488]|nr:protein of unknown function [Streptantibioticus cattleyicolor NRRL 8057 = DSM 46488]
MTESLVTFKNGVDQILADLEHSDASHTRIRDQIITKAAFGADHFPEAADISAAYDEVHDRLATLSQLLGDQLEAMGITVDMARHGYEDVDADQAQRLMSIQRRTQQYVDRLNRKGVTPADPATTTGHRPPDPVGDAKQASDI